MFKSIKHTLTSQTHLAPLAVFRIVFGAIMLFSILRFIANGWVYELYVSPTYYFSYYGFEWVKPLPELGMYFVFGIMAISFLFQALGLFYKAASIVSFASFTYVELLDKTNYLNHYYFVSIICLLLIFVPAHRYFSLDVIRKPELKKTHAPNWVVLIFKLQLLLVYFYAGLAKLNPDWLFNAMPLKIWLPSKANIPLIGTLLTKEWVAYLFSWFGAIYDLSIPFLLLFSRTRFFAYFFVIAFHIMTWLLFQIGMFPFIMIGATLIFFSVDFHRNLIYKTKNLFAQKAVKEEIEKKLNYRVGTSGIAMALLCFHFALQVLIPFRYALYPGNLFWTEQGYRFSWRVMLMEKAGYAIFHATDPKTNQTWEVNNYDFLSPNQEKMMSTQPDMILQFAHYLEEHYQGLGIENPKIRAEVYVSLNGTLSQAYIDPTLDLTKIKESFKAKNWILDSPQKQQH
ncbi:MAG: HTTM domain-containing protein [Bacteroidetes bacterium]|nr:MAG: HTTM domain-containing protein [Bacteroidota bacterium]MBL1143743.1 HTTM domain-containing protein [Bacteroidota bacterium]NOG56545.1 HTTM domain-containing protein [Bacteroidota bacterium]